MTDFTDTPTDPYGVIHRAICRHIGDLTEFVIITSDDHRNYYVQAVGHAVDDTIVLHVEAVSDEFLEPGVRLGQAGAEVLRRLGWTRQQGDSNWWRTFVVTIAEDVDPVAETMLRTLREAYGYEGGRLRVESGAPIIPLESLQGSEALARLILTLRAQAAE